MSTRPGLLVSVRSAEEAQVALAGGATLIDVKEPTRGALGRADDAVIAAVVRCVGGRVPVSAALGELVQAKRPDIPPRVTFVKLGLARSASIDWRALLSSFFDRGLGPGNTPQLVIAAYADWQAAQAPPLADVCAFAQRQPDNILLVDTFAKGARRTLLDWVAPAKLARLCDDCRAAKVRVALAGSLGPAEILQLRVACPDWFAVRGAACEQARRDAMISPDRVRDLCDLVRGADVSKT